MVSKRARVSRNMGTRINDLDTRSMSADIKSRTSEVDVDDITTRIATLEEEAANLASPLYRAEQDQQYLGNERAIALLDPAYVGPGRARVYFNLDSTELSGPFEWKGTYYSWGNRVVNMVRREGVWFIEGHTSETLSPDGSRGYGGVTNLNPVNNWKHYSEFNGTYQYGNIRAQRLPSGIVVLSGMVQGGNTDMATLLTALPVGFRPDIATIFPMFNGGVWKGIAVGGSGAVYIISSMDDSYSTLDGIAYPAAGVADWTEIGSAGSGSSFSNGWVPYQPAGYGTPAYWKDPYGFVWYRGLISSGTQGSDALLATIPASHRPAANEHHSSVCSNQYGAVGISSTSGLLWKQGNVGSVGTGYTSLGGISSVTSDALTLNNWVTHPFFDGWSNYDGIHTTAAFTRRKDGLSVAKGLVKGGSVGANSRITTVPPRQLPSSIGIHPRPVSGAAGRLDIFGHRSATSSMGMINVNTGTNGFVSLDGMKWVVGDI